MTILIICVLFYATIFIAWAPGHFKLMRKKKKKQNKDTGPKQLIETAKTDDGRVIVGQSHGLVSGDAESSAVKALAEELKDKVITTAGPVDKEGSVSEK